MSSRPEKIQKANTKKICLMGLDNLTKQGDVKMSDQLVVTSLPWKSRLNKAFTQMRKSGLLAYQNFSCCMTCGCYELAEKAKTMEKQPIGYVFYRRQNGDRIRRDEQMGETPSVYLAFGTYVSEWSAKQIADLVIGCLTANGLTVEWNGDVCKRILVILK